MLPTPVRHAQVRVDLEAVRSNVGVLAASAAGAQVMAVVKADAYGHGLVPVARAALAGGATWLGTAALAEALHLRSAGVGGRILSWLAAPGERWADALRQDVDVSAYAPWALDEIAAAARETGRTARVHLKVDTGLGRGGAGPADWPDLVDAAAKAVAEGSVELVGVWTHLAWADAPGHPTIGRQLAVYREALEVAFQAGLRPQLRHVANSAATLTLPEAHFDLVRPGLAVYGLSPVPDVSTPEQLGLRPAMRVSARLALVKRVPAGHGVSYGHEYVTARDTTLGLVPLGYADGVPRHAGGSGPVLAAGRVRPVAGRVSMDQVVVDLGDDPAAPGDEVVLFGDATRGEPTAEDWARASGTISYEVVTRIAPRLPRTYLPSGDADPCPPGEVP